MNRNARNLPQIYNDLTLITLHELYYKDKKEKKNLAVLNGVQLTIGGVLGRPLRIQQKDLGSKRAQ